MHKLTKVPAPWAPNHAGAGKAPQGRRGRPSMILPPLLVRRYTEDFVSAGRTLAELALACPPHVSEAGAQSRGGGEPCTS